MISERHKKQLEKVHALNKIHGMAGTHIYYVWAQMLQRCHKISCKQFKNYGARGISVCQNWKKFESFYKWANSHGYTKGLTLDRINNNGNYSPQNCRWVTQKTQTNNQRRNRVIEYMGKTKTLMEWCESLSIPYMRAFDRLYRQGWSIEKAFTTPKQAINVKKSQYRKKTNITTEFN